MSSEHIHTSRFAKEPLVRVLEESTAEESYAERPFRIVGRL